MRIFTLVLLLLAQIARAEFVVSPDHSDGKYAIGDTVTWTVAWRGDNAPASFEYITKRDGLTELNKGAGSFDKPISAKIEQPGTLLLEVKSGDKKSYGGAYAGLDKLTPAAARPDDFNDFWSTKLRELQSIPFNPQLKKVDLTEHAKPNVDYFHLTLDNIRNTRVHGQLARPTSGQKFPALLVVQWAGVYGLHPSWAVDRAADGWLVLNILPHDLPIDRSEDFYKEQREAGPLKNYWEIGNDDREQSYYLRMYLSCHRAAEYLTTRDDWDGRTLVVMGASQGGQQALVTAAIHPKITAALSLVPAGCDQLGPSLGRAGFPMWYWKTQGKDEKKGRETSKYFDVANFTPRIKCPVLVGVGLIDDVCPPTGIYAAVNQITSPKEVIMLPVAGHQNVNGSQNVFDDRCWRAWLPALRQGQPAPVRTE